MSHYALYLLLGHRFKCSAMEVFQEQSISYYSEKFYLMNVGRVSTPCRRWLTSLQEKEACPKVKMECSTQNLIWCNALKSFAFQFSQELLQLHHGRHDIIAHSSEDGLFLSILF